MRLSGEKVMGRQPNCALTAASEVADPSPMLSALALAGNVDGRGSRDRDVVTVGQGELLGGRAGVLHTAADAGELTRQLVLAAGQLGPGPFQGPAKYGRIFGDEIEHASREGAASADAAREGASLDGEGTDSSGPK